MSFRELQPGSSPVNTPSPSRWVGILIVLGLPVIALANLVPRAARWVLGGRTVHLESDGWLAEWTVAHLACPYCSAQVRRLDFRGNPLPVLAPKRGLSREDRPVVLATPVGVFQLTGRTWHRGHWEPSPYLLRGEFSPDDQRRGFYPTEYCSADEECSADPGAFVPGRPVIRKAATPAEWCLWEPTRDSCPPYWLDPFRAEEVFELLAGQTGKGAN